MQGFAHYCILLVFFPAISNELERLGTSVSFVNNYGAAVLTGTLLSLYGGSPYSEEGHSSQRNKIAPKSVNQEISNRQLKRSQHGAFLYSTVTTSSSESCAVSSEFSIASGVSPSAGCSVKSTPPSSGAGEKLSASPSGTPGSVPTDMSSKPSEAMPEAPKGSSSPSNSLFEFWDDTVFHLECILLFLFNDFTN